MNWFAWGSQCRKLHQGAGHGACIIKVDVLLEVSVGGVGRVTKLRPKWFARMTSTNYPGILVGHLVCRARARILKPKQQLQMHRMLGHRGGRDGRGSGKQDSGCQKVVDHLDQDLAQGS